MTAPAVDPDEAAALLVAAAIHRVDWARDATANPEPGAIHRVEARAAVQTLRDAGWRAPAEIRAETAAVVREVVDLATNHQADQDRYLEWVKLVRDVHDGVYTPPGERV